MNGRICTQCHEFKTADCFSARNGTKNPLVSRCHECRRDNHKENPERNRERARDYYLANKELVSARSKELRKENIGKYLVSEARGRAKKRGLAFNITKDDVPVPDICPVLGIPLFVSESSSSPNSPTLDRIIPALGYVKGNVRVISHRANTIKSDATIEEIAAVYNYVLNATNGVSSHAWPALGVALTAWNQ